MGRKNHISYFELVEKYQEKGYELQTYGSINERGKRYPLYKIVVNPRCKKTLLITTGFHGEEANGPISLLQIFDKIAQYAKQFRVRLIVYICVNPSGFQLKRRYPPSMGRRKGNNCFMNYQLLNGKWVGILEPGTRFAGYKLVDSPSRGVNLLRKDVLKYDVPEASLDIHQQEGCLDTGDVYSYIYDQRPLYKRIMKKLSKVAKIARNDPASTFDKGKQISYRIDNDGFIVLHDGTITDMFYRMGSKYVVAAETDTRLPLDKVCQTNLIWIKSLIKLVAKTKRG